MLQDPLAASHRLGVILQKGNSMEGFGWIMSIVLGAIAGWIAEKIMKTDTGLLMNIILGIVGAFVATWLGQALGWYRAGEGAGLIGAIVGALIVLFIWHMIAGRRASDTTYR